MPSEAAGGGGGEQRRQVQTMTKPHPAEPENLQCPRCESTNTKFCYYNNYNLSQPRYFCKSCRRYWTRGGTLRNVPVGGGSRKNSKRSRPTSSSSVSTLPLPLPLTPPPPPLPAFATNTTSSSSEGEASTNLSEPTFMSLLTANELGQGFGLVHSGFEDMGLGLGFGFGSAMENQLGGSDGSGGSMMDGGDYHLGWPDLAISTPGKGLE